MGSRPNSTIYLWFDTEYTELDLERTRLMQVALVVTDSGLNRVLPRHQDVNLFIRLQGNERVSHWVLENLPDVVELCVSNQAVDVAEADSRLAHCVDKASGPSSKDIGLRPILAGNSVYADWFLARKFLPVFASRLNYRLLDVTALKLQWQDWFGGEEFDKDNISMVNKYFPGGEGRIDGKPHDAYYDTRASIAELRFYRAHLSVKTVEKL